MNAIAALQHTDRALFPHPDAPLWGIRPAQLIESVFFSMGSHKRARFRGLIKEQTPFEKQGKQSTGRHCCPHFDRSNQAFPSAYIWSLSGPHPAARGVEIQMLSHLYVLRGVYSGQIYRTSASGLSFCLTHSCLVPYGPYLF